MTIPSLRVTGAVLALALILGPLTIALAGPPTIVVIGGKKQGYPPGEHDYPDGTLKIERMLKAMPQFAQVGAVVKVFPTGFPKNLAEIDDASAVVLYFGMNYSANGNTHPLDDGETRQEMSRLMARGVGLVALHQSFTVPDKASKVPFGDWLGGIRIGMADRTTEIAPVQIVGAGHPVAHGLRPFSYHDEFYPSIDFAASGKITPILRAKVHVQHRNNAEVFEDPARQHVIAWAAERADGGRAFGFTGAHYLAALDQPQIRMMLLNAILWAAKLEVPSTVTTSMEPLTQRGRAALHIPEHVVLPASQSTAEIQPWGRLEWFASRALGNSTKITVGRATIGVGKSNPVHWHPNCDEVLHVQQGRILHRVGDKQYELHAGDTVTIAEGVLHNARNIGDEDAILDISFSSADRVAIGE